ncbi:MULTISPECIES: bacteriorhodopsin [unclassified Curtobacterium]|uniref:bacteriorhodopsin n=1 Tax=unclassified Curtobacterium TaxID=257496 RepID=UPI0015E886AC|nr:MULTISPECIES: bacteriorhodopsin [unclassified Curtobacterium]WIB33254.1 bacteriorhodopsin [Curtobacterium sp. MCSS17_005]
MDTVSPWKATLTSAEHSIIFYALAVAGLALLAYFIKSWTSRNEVSPRYRTSVYASMGITAVAFLSYVLLMLKFDLGYDPKGDSWVPNSDALLSWAPRYMDWSVTVPMLMIELIGVSMLVGAAARRIRSIGVAAAFLMIATGYIGGVVVDDGESIGALWLWGVISGVFMVVLYLVIVYVMVGARRQFTDPEAVRSYSSACILLLVTFFVYPIVFGLQGWGHGGAVTTWMQVLLSAADIVAKVGFGVLIHKVAKLRTAADVRDHEDTHPESVWWSSVKASDAVLPPLEASDRTAAHATHSRPTP